MSKRDIWSGLECMSSGAGLMADWEWACGSALEVVRPFLKPTEKQSDSFPCAARPACDCRHEVRDTDFGLIAVCVCGDGGCDAFEVEPKDVLVYGFDVERFGSEVARVLGFSGANGSAYVSLGLREVGTYAAVAAPVYLSFARREALLREVGKLLGQRDGPFVLLTPTGSSWSAEVEAMARAQGGAHISLSSVVDVGADGRFVSKGTVEPMLREFARRVASLRDSSGTLKSIHREIATVRTGFGELRSGKERLEEMLAEGVFAFTRKVDAISFKVLCTILAEGDVAKASRTLGMPDPSVRTLMRRWRGLGKEYAAMLDLVRWRKKVGGKETVPLNEAVLQGKSETTDYPGLLSDVLDGLLSVTEENWRERCEELAEVLRPVLRA